MNLITVFNRNQLLGGGGGLILLTLSMLPCSVWAQTESPLWRVPEIAQDFSPDRLLVKFKLGVTNGALNNILIEAGVSELKNFRYSGIVLLSVGNNSINEVIETLSDNDAVEYVERDGILVINVISTIPNDPSFSSLWGLHNTGQSGGVSDADIDAPEAWNIRTGAPSLVVGVIDTGIDYTHPDLAANMWINPGEIANNGIDDDDNGYIDDIHGINTISNDGDPMDDHRHGTHVAGTIGAVGDNGVGVTGVNWQVQLMALKFISADGYGYTSNAIEAIEYTIKMKTEHGINIMLTSNSWGGGGYNLAMFDAIQASKDAGILFVAAAGNNASNNDTSSFYPASYDLDNVIAVASTTRNDVLSSFSNYGANSVHLAAPGSSILSTTPDNSYSSFSGTSMAAPHVSGAAALLWADQPGYNYAEIKDTLIRTVDPINALAGKVVSNGRLNIYNALVDVVTSDTDPPTPDPMTWATTPYATSHSSISMTAATASDTSGVEYFFECTTVGNCNDSGWQDSSTYEDTNLTLETTYTYRVKARDKSSNQNETAFSTEESVIPDTDPPTPDPMTWATMPYATSQSTISMIATTASDASSVEYFFECTTVGNCNDSGWQNSPIYEDIGLTPETTYTYWVKARDKSPNQNETAFSIEESATTDAQPEWTELTYDDFELGLGNYSDGGKDCKRYTGIYAHQGSSAINIQDDSGDDSSFFYTNGVDVTGYVQIKIEFWFKAMNLASGEGFWVQYYDGSTWHTVARYANGSDFNNNDFYDKTVYIDEGDEVPYTYTFPTNMKIRFMNNASGNRDDVYIDEIRVSVK
jgi:subtilisin family serine protease